MMNIRIFDVFQIEKIVDPDFDGPRLLALSTGIQQPCLFYDTFQNLYIENIDQT